MSSTNSAKTKYLINDGWQNNARKSFFKRVILPVLIFPPVCTREVWSLGFDMIIFTVRRSPHWSTNHCCQRVINSFVLYVRHTPVVWAHVLLRQWMLKCGKKEPTKRCSSNKTQARWRRGKIHFIGLSLGSEMGQNSCMLQNKRVMPSCRLHKKKKTLNGMFKGAWMCFLYDYRLMIFVIKFLSSLCSFWIFTLGSTVKYLFMDLGSKTI